VCVFDAQLGVPWSVLFGMPACVGCILGPMDQCSAIVSDQPVAQSFATKPPSLAVLVWFDLGLVA
jgi:hypothetical protein